MRHCSVSTCLYVCLGCEFPVSRADFGLCLRKFRGKVDKVDRGGLAKQRREFKTYRKSTAQMSANWDNVP